jgi:hypothetical protein
VPLVIVGAIVVIVPLFMSFLLKALALLAPVFNPVACISIVEHVTQVLVIPISPLAALLQWSEATGQVSMGTLLVVMLMNLCFVVAVEGRVDNGCCVQNRVETLHVCIDFFIVFW